MKVVQSQSYPLLQRDTLSRRDSLLPEEIKDNLLDNLPVITLDEDELNKDAGNNIASMLTAGRDPFYAATAFNFSQVRYRFRGYDADASTVLINGVPMKNPDNGYTPWSAWSGLNDMMRNRDMSIGLRANPYAFGLTGTTTFIDARASRQRRQTNIGYALSNRNYTHRFNASYASGMNAKGWAYALAGSVRRAAEGYVPGTGYQGYSYFIAADKQLGTKQLLSVVLLGAPVENARQGAATEEMQLLANDHYYNPYWGYQNGKKRNASVSRSHQPYLLLTHEYTIRNNTVLTTALGYSTGNRSTTGLDWYNAPDPRPDYYRYLPSYTTDETQRKALEARMAADEQLRQINWQRLYDVNRASNETVKDANGIAGNDVTGLRSHYILEERVQQTRKLSFSSTLHATLKQQVDISAGLCYQQQSSHYYKKVNDLLGGDFYVNLNQFAERDFPSDPIASQNDADTPNRILKPGDRFGYNYTITVRETSGWLQAVFRQRKFDLFAATSFSGTAYWRTGHVRNGLFPTHSLGKSTVNTFSNYGVKAGINYKLSGRQYIYLNGAYMTRAPFFENVYISPRTRDTRQDKPVNEIWQSAEVGYVMNAPACKLRVSGYYTSITHGMNVLSFYHDDYRNFVNYALSDIDRLYYGAEAGIDAKILPNVSLNLAASFGRYYYNSRQHASVTLDNSTALLSSETVYVQNYRIAGTPQQVYTAGITYRSPDEWFISLTGNYYDGLWLDFNPIRRTFAATEGLDYKGSQWHEVVDQLALQGQYTLDCFAGYSWRFARHKVKKQPVYLVLNAGVNNLMNNRNIISGGYEQLRFDFADKNTHKFPPKLFYAYGLNYFISAGFRF
jgi:hypothetical protein